MRLPDPLTIQVTGTFYGKAFLAGLHTKGAANVGFATACSSENDNIMSLANILAGSESLNEFLV